MAPDPRQDELPIDLLHRYLAGEATSAQMAAVEAWMEEEPGRREEMNAMRRGLGEVSIQTRMGVESAVAGVLQASGLTPRRTLPPRSIAPRGYQWIAAAVGMGMMALVVGLLLTRSISQPVRELATVPGSQVTITLRDGTRVILAPASRIRVPADFGRGMRTVELDGEAYFAVVHDAAHPFQVHVGGALVTDIGTAFNIRHYADDADVRVAVTQGRVRIGAPGASRADPLANAWLAAGDIATVVDHHILLAHRADVTAAMAWTQGGLVFEDTPLPRVVQQLERTFNVKITLSDSTLTREVVTASLSHATLEEVLEVVTHAIGAQYHQSGNTVQIQRRNAVRNHTPDRIPPLTTVNATRA